MITTLKLGIEGEFLNLILLTFERPVANIIQTGDQKNFPLFGNMERMLTLTILCNIVLALLANARRKEKKKIKGKKGK